MTEILAKISLTSKGDLKFECLKKEVVPDKLYPVSGSRIGTVVLDTKHNLGITTKALKKLVELFENAKCDGGDLGDIDWFASEEKDYCFGWLGESPRIFKKNEEVYKAGQCAYTTAILEKHFVEIES